VFIEIQLRADLALGETGCEVPHHGKLGRVWVLDEVALFAIRSGHGEVPLDGGRDRR
jgi:hypothetical protein